MTKSVLLCSIAYLVAVQPAVGDENLHVQLTGVFSDMCYGTESGDISGMEIFVLYSRDGYFVVFQSGEGSPDAPVVLPAAFSADTLRFTIPKPCAFSGDFTGIVSQDALTGSISGYPGYAADLVLKRRLSYWQQAGDGRECE